MATAEAQYTQAKRPIAVTTPLGEDALLLEKLTGSEGLSRPFRFNLTVLAQPGTTIAFDELLGQAAAVRLDLPAGVDGRAPSARYFHGIVHKLSEGATVRSASSGDVFLRYWLEIVPQFWLLNKRVTSRIFQQKTAPEILQEVLAGLDVAYELNGAYEPRNYCVQYQESDFRFASRLMEEEGIYFFFKHSDSGHQMVVADAASSHLDLPQGATVVYNDFSGLRDRSLHEDRVHRWLKTQEIGAGKFTTWDFCFEMPERNLEATKDILGSAAAGTVTHSLAVGGNDAYEVFDYPGGYAQRYDGVDPGGADRASDLEKITPDGERTVGVRMEQATVPDLTVTGESNVRGFTPGYKFQLDQHLSGNGQYILTDVEHSAGMEGTYTTDEAVALRYGNRFHCLPVAVPYRPPRTTAKPTIQGTQTAFVVGPAGSEIFTDKYGRVKAQFHWDRAGQNNSDSSCWMRVAQPWAGKRWGVVFLPRVGDEVVVDFIGGDPDRPIIVGSVYNADHMPPYELPTEMTKSVIKTRSTTGGDAETYNELRFEDKTGEEEIYFHAEKDFNRVVENSDTLKVGFEKMDPGDQTIEIYNNRTERVQEGNESITVEKGNRTVTVDKGNDLHQVKEGDRTVIVDQGNDTHQIKAGNRVVEIDQGNDTLTIAQGDQTITLDAGQSTLEAATQIELKVGGSSIKITPSGITLKATMIKVEGTGMTQVKGNVVQVKGGATTEVAGGVVRIN